MDPQSNLSPNFEDRFAKIDLKNPRLRANFPAHGPNTPIPPSKRPKGPVLSTSARAESRINSRSVSVNNLYATLHAKTPSRLDPGPASARKPKRLAPPNPADRSMSYMKETSSSSKKVRNPFQESMPKTRRVFSTRPSDITNLDLPKARSRSPLSPSKRHVSQPVPSAKVDVYTRLYNDSKARAPQRPARQVSRTFEASRPSSKVQSLAQLYRTLHEEDPSMFEGVESDSKLVCNVPIHTPQNVAPGTDLEVYENGEISRVKDLYYVPDAAAGRAIDIRNYSNNYGFDDKGGNYVVHSNDHINFRYEVQSVLGTGSFGNVVKCLDKKYRSINSGNDRVVAIKIIKNDLNWSLQAVYEIKMLKHLSKVQGSESQADASPDCPVLKYYDHFHFRGHMCIVVEPLSVNLYTMLEMVRFQGLSLRLIKQFAQQILHGLDYIHSNNVLHCDIKPENIMIKVPPGYSTEGPVDETSLTVKIVDFGSSCFTNEISYSYIQSRFYRAPEVILGAKYDRMIDIWSAGCVLTELFTGDPLLPGKNELEQIAIIVEMFGAPPSHLIIQQKNQLLKSLREHKIPKLPTDDTTSMAGLRGKPADEKSIKRTLLYTLFDLEGKLNMQFLNMRIQAAVSNSLPGSMQRKYYKIGAKSLEVRLKARALNEDNIHQFILFLEGIFRWEPSKRATAAELLQHPFITS